MFYRVGRHVDAGNGRALRVTEIVLRRDRPQASAKILTPKQARFVEEYSST